LLNMPLYTVRDHMRTKKLPAVKIGSHWRVPKALLQEFLERKLQGGQ
jgi:excisionase family DNA binding protein